MIYKNVTRYITYAHSYNEVKMHSYKYSLLGVVAAVVMSLTAIAPASAEPIESSNPSSNSITLSAEDKMEISDILTSYGVDEGKAQYLVSRYEHGYAWDSFTPGKQPIAATQRKTLYSVETVKTYEDGSIAVSTVPNFEALADAPQTRGITGCQYRQSGSTRYWKNCDGTVNLAVISMGFNFNYQNVNHSNPKITHYGPYHHHIIGGALSNFRFDRISNSQVRLSADLDVAFRGFPAGWTAWMQVNVTGDNAWTSNN